MIDPTLDSWQRDRLLQLKRLLLGVGGAWIKAERHKQGTVQERVSHLPAYVKLSNSVTLSAFVQTPTLPASVNVVSSTSNRCLPSKLSLKWLPANSTRSVCHWPDVTGSFAP